MKFARVISLFKIFTSATGFLASIFISLKHVKMILFVKPLSLIVELDQLGFLVLQLALALYLGIQLYSFFVRELTFSVFFKLYNSLMLTCLVAFSLAVFFQQGDLTALVDNAIFKIIYEDCLQYRVIYFENLYNEFLLQKLKHFRSQDYIFCVDLLEEKFNLIRPLFNREFFIRTEPEKLKALAFAIAEQHTLEVSNLLRQPETPKTLVTFLKSDISDFFFKNPLLTVTAIVIASVVYFHFSWFFSINIQQDVPSQLLSYEKMALLLETDISSSRLRRVVKLFGYISEELKKQNSPERQALLEALCSGFPTLLALVEDYPDVFNSENLEALFKLLNTK